MNPFFSIIIPTYNRAGSLRQTIASVITQSYSDWELIVIDDGSTDHTKTTVTAFLSDQRVRYFYQENRELNAARNAGVCQIKGQYASFLDDDDRYLPDHLEKMHAGIQKFGEEYALYCGQVTIEYPNKTRQNPGYNNIDHALIQLWRRPTNFLPLVIRRDVLQTHPFDEDDLLLNDFFWLNGVLLKHKLRQLPDYTAVYRVHPKNRSTAYLNEELLQKNLRKIETAYSTKGVAEVVPLNLLRQRTVHQYGHAARTLALQGEKRAALRVWWQSIGSARLGQVRELVYTLMVILRG